MKSKIVFIAVIRFFSSFQMTVLPFLGRILLFKIKIDINA
ncbi:hypothetical protein Cabys_2694 [Caldithrix abyssi DSM 13497]|uniref:Uncharacterized protein n=1 Tax=Caldithrix abyssi DSM 13497 TaxID=880073 RepID=A0A1J1CBT8_CALAY|nr:hypothetical protein Cabys_2694 [Caldithrix abyssi DSM 13497]